MRPGRCIAVLIITVHSAPHIQPGKAEAVAYLFSQTSRAFKALAKDPQTAAVKPELEVRLTLAASGHQINDASDCVGAVNRGSGSAQDFNSIQIDRQEIGYERHGRTVDVRRIAHAQAVEKYGRVEIALSSQSNSRQRPVGTLLLHAHAGQPPHTFGER